ncbi:helix-turn-helix transcriptional regulator [Halomonas sp. I5-271120]|uniref:helix-turn-helix domain-containing protein n=1 Tax=Halomonas sp. I5-271120 TaxID=3061632 RepID=UPI0027152D04|nr:helix-turn-helix domain-containing protein [Halomonas sp. I5-271120]
MPRIKRNDFTDTQLREAYEQAGNLSDMAKSLGISYPTAWDWAREIGIKTKRRGYTAPPVPISGAQCRYAREYLEMTRDDFCEACGSGKTAIRKFELGQSTPRRSTLEKIMTLFQRYGIVFAPDGTFQEGPSEY